MDESQLRAFLTNEGRQFPGLADLPRQWDRLESDADRTRMLAGASNWAFTKAWAWEGLRRLLEVLLDRGEPIPGILQTWANDYAAGRRHPPGHGRGRRRNDDRDVRIVVAMRLMRGGGVGYEDSIWEVANALALTDEAVRSAIRKAKRDRPF